MYYEVTYTVYVCNIMQHRDKVIVSEAESSVELGRFQSVFSKSSSGSSLESPLTELQDGSPVKPTSQLQRENVRLATRVKELERMREVGSERDEAYLEQATVSVQKTSDAEQREKRLQSENTKLETKLREAERVAAQVDSLAEQVHVLYM